MSYLCSHAHSSIGSIRDSILKIPDYVKKCKENDIIPALTDHGSMSGVWKFYKECKKQDVKSVIGQEFYFVQDQDCKDNNYHLCLYAKDNVGLRNLNFLSTVAFTQNFYRKPRLWKDALANHSEGLIVTTACCFNNIAQMIINGQTDDAVSEINWFKNLFGEDFYLEVHNHTLEEEVSVREFYRNYAQEKKIGIIAGTDVHYLNNEDKRIHNIFKQLAYGSVGKANDDAFNGTGYHVHTIDEMNALFTPEELNYGLQIADKCNVSIKHSEYHLPKFELPTDCLDSYTHLRQLAFKGLTEKGLHTKREYVDRLEYELNIFHLADLENYFLIVWDYVYWMECNDILPGPGRGSMGSSLVCYCLGITKIDPIAYGLIFARAVNAGRLLQYSFFED